MKKNPVPMIWRGEISFVYLFWAFDVAASIVAIASMQYLSMALSMQLKSTIGLAAGVLFLIYNFIVMVGVFRGAGKSDISLTLKMMSRSIACFLFLISLWTVVYFGGRGFPMIF